MNMVENQKAYNIEQEIIELIKSQKPQTNQEIITQISVKYSASEKEVVAILLQLKNDGRINFVSKKPSVNYFILSKDAVWYWIILALALIATFSTLVIPDASQIAYLRQVSVVGFVTFAPGYAFVKSLFPTTDLIKYKNISSLERIVLSFSMSFMLVAVTGLILNFTPWGITTVPITLSLFVLTFVISTIAILREYSISGKKTEEIHALWKFRQ